MFNFFQKPFGLDISDCSIKVISLLGSPEKPKLLAMGKIILEPGIIENGKIFNKEKLKEVLSNLISNPKVGKIKTSNFIFSLPESKFFVHFFKIGEDLKEKEKLQKIKSEASRIFPYPLEDLYYDFIIFSGEALLVAIPKNIVDDYLEIFKTCQIQPLALEIESESLARALIENENKVVLIADFGAKMTNLSIFDEKRLKLSISTPVAGNRFTQIISEKLKILPPEAEKLKKEVGLNPDKKEGRIFLILQDEIQEIIEEIRKIESYFEEKTQKKIEKIILAGGSALLPYLPEYLSENLEKEVLISDPWKKINIDILKEKEYSKEVLESESILYSIAIGLALRGLAKEPKKAGINLLKEVKY